ncbi:MAG: flagellar protein FliS [Roseovarius sp.]|uniref:flagellar export chaperone FliS n=1 Tax=Roseovarius sp. TaxID=1486281 RepID=UPI0019A428A5|nr:flagellar protein FliS [Roseovarius sp.]MBC7180893.1 flagellar protein FliS [Roseovarius sp.]MBQ0752570.1 flagellar protein FliS [Roseovarius sp.]MBQ0811523.1 flagellar protein FliS [Roseovarius sp.]
MSFAFARSRYRQAETLVQEAATDPYDIVFVTLRELNRSLGVLARTQEDARPLPSDHVNRVLTAIYILQSSLDFEAGGDLAGDLFQLYEFARFHVLKAMRGEEGARLSEAAAAMGDILDAWQQIGSQVKAQAV